MLAVNRSAGVAQQVNLKNSLQRRCHQKSKTGVSVAPQKGLVSSKNVIQVKEEKHVKHYFLCTLFSAENVNSV